MDSQLVILGAGGHAKVCYEIALAMDKWAEIFILDDNLKNNYFEIDGLVSNYEDYPKADFFVAVGSNEIRRKFYEMISEKQFKLATLIHPNAIISNSVSIGNGSVIMPGAIINSSTEIGKGVIINTSVTVDHDNYINDYAHISPGSHLAGNVSVGRGTWIGMGTNIINNVIVAKDTIVGSSSNVIKNIDKPGTYYGNPAKLIKERQV